MNIGSIKWPTMLGRIPAKMELRKCVPNKESAIEEWIVISTKQILKNAITRFCDKKDS